MPYIHEIALTVICLAAIKFGIYISKQMNKSMQARVWIDTNKPTFVMKGHEKQIYRPSHVWPEGNTLFGFVGNNNLHYQFKGNKSFNLLDDEVKEYVIVLLRRKHFVKVRIKDVFVEQMLDA